MSHSSPKAEQVAEAVLTLINSRPRTTAKDELVAVVGKALSTPDVEGRKNRAEWIGLVAQAARAELRAAPGWSDAEVRASHARLVSIGAIN